MSTPFFDMIRKPHRNRTARRNGATTALCALALAALACLPTLSFADTPLAAVEYHISGTSLAVTPAVLSVPKGIPGSVLVSVVSGGSTNSAGADQLASGAYIQAVIRGPGFPAPQRLISAPNAPLVLPPIGLVGDYQLDNIALIDAATGATRLEGSPSSVPVHVFDQLLISSVTSRPLTMDEIQQKGIVIDESNFRAIEFNVSFVLDGKTIPVTFPVVSPQFSDSTELIPAAELEAKLLQAAAINQQIASTMVSLPPDFQTANLNIQLQGINFQVVDPGAGQSLALSIPAIPALMVIPGNIGYLHQFFSVKIFTENGAPLGSGLSVDNVQAKLNLPPGPDGIVSTNYAQPGDDPLRFARIGPNKIIKPVQPVVDPGPDGVLETGDDISRLQPGETGQGEFLVEGLQEGLQVMNLDLTADLHGLVNGVVQVKGKAAGSVLVRNPTFSITFTHPSIVRVSEPYTASITVLNTGVTPANLVQVSLNRNSISGAALASGQEETIQLGTILPGHSATAIYRMVAQRTGQILFSDLTTGDDSVTGRFRFTMGVDAQGVPLSPDTIAMPDYVNYLPADLVEAANRVLGQALSIATAAQLPPGIVGVGNNIITRRVLDLAEAGQRVHYGDPLKRVLTDLLRDWQGGRQPDTGFDSLLRTSDAGAQWRSVLFTNMDLADNLDGSQRLVERAPDLAGLGQEFALASAGPGQLRTDFSGTTNSATLDGSTQPYALVYAATNGEWAMTPVLSNAVFTWTFTNTPPVANMAVLIVSTNGNARQLTWQVPNPPASAVYQFALSNGSPQLQADTNGDGTIDTTLAPGQLIVNELPPSLVAVQQDLSVVAGRPSNPCIGPPYLNYGTVVAVVYSKAVTQSTAGKTNSYIVEGNNGANSVQIQPSGRVALLNLRKGISAIIPRKMTIAGVTDVRSNLLASVATPIQSVYPGTLNPFTGGVAVTGRVLKGDGSPVGGVPVTLTMYDLVPGPFSCEQWVRRVSQVLTDSGGNFDFDFVMSGISYSVSATDTSGLSQGALQVIIQSTLTDKPDTQTLQQLVNGASDPNSLLALLSAGSLPQAVAVVQGLDRALVQDVVNIGSGREGQNVPIVLRFRGRGTVSGQVFGADGVTPIANAAVNLYPDPSSRELGRGVFSDGGGNFIFPGVPLGVYTVDVATSDKRGATVLGLLDTPNQATNMTILLPDKIVSYGRIRGQVFDSDNLTPIANARIFLGQYDNGGSTIRGVVRIVDADADGSYEITNAPIQVFDIVAVTFDGTRKGVRSGIIPIGDQTIYENITLQAATTVFGRVQFDDGRPATNALVAGGAALVRSDVNGNFQLSGVPVGGRTISAGLERNPAAGIDFPRLGSASANIIAGAANYVVVKLRPAGRIFGKVFDAQGNLQTNLRVAIPQDGGFYWTDADANGNYVFENLGLGNYTISAPANAVAPQLDTTALGQQLSSGSEDQILAAFKEAIRVFVGADDPLANGTGADFHPSSWGYTHANITFDGANVNADVRFIPQGSLSGKVLNGQGVPIGAKVRLTGLGPDLTGAPVMTVRGDANSDPATGTFSFSHVLLNGAWGLQAASPFYPVIIQTNGFTTVIDPDVSGVVLQFPPVKDVNGRITGHVFNPDGTPVGAGAQVHISVSSDYQIITDTNGFFDTQTAFPAVNVAYSVEVFDPSTGLKGRSYVAMTPGITNVVDVHLLSRDSTVQITVLKADGNPAPGAAVELDQGSYPYDAPIFGIADTNGLVSFEGLWEGNYSATAQFTVASTKLFARGGGTAPANGLLALTLHLGSTGSIQGTFVQQDLVTPVLGAQVTIGNLGFASTDTNGFFRFDGVPVGSYQISSSDPVTGANARTTATISFNSETQNVLLVEGTLGTVNGFVLSSFNTGAVASASVQISFNDGVTPSRTVTTAPNGGFSFPGSPMGPFTLNATYKVPNALNVFVSGHASGTLTTVSNLASVDIQLQPLTSLFVHIVRPDGVTPAQNARVFAAGIQQDTGANGNVQFNNLFVPGSYGITAVSQIGGELHSGAQTNVNLTSISTNSVVTLVLSGVGNIAGKVVGSDGSTPVNNAEITVQFQDSLFAGGILTALSDAQGKFAFSDVPIGSFLVTAASQSLADSENGAITNAGQTNIVFLRLGASGSLMGRLVRADGLTPVGDQDLTIDYMSQSDNAGRAVYHTADDGFFRFDNIPTGKIHVASAAPEFGGIINFNTALTNNGQLLNLGDIPYDEDLPRIIQVTPPDGSVEVPITSFVELLFSEALDTNSIAPNGIFIRGTNGSAVTSTVALVPDTNGVRRIVRVQPVAPLKSKQTYQLIVLAGELPGAGGVILGTGPMDLVGRSMAAPFSSHFTTADGDPPVLLSIFPSNNAVQIDPSAVPRLSFNETIRSTNFAFNLIGPTGPVAGTASVGINGQVLSFVPTVFLKPNAIYTMTVSNVFDLAGNRSLGEPFITTFATLDTLGPVISVLHIANNAPPTAGADVFIEAVLATNEPGASVRFTQDFNPVGATTNNPYRVSVKLPNSGSTTIRAIATDQFGNDGQVVQLVVTVTTPQPPTLGFTLVSPTNTPIPSGSAVVVDVTASGDTTIATLTAVVGGAATGPLVTTNGPAARVQGIVFTNATADQFVQIFAQATDSLGFSSGQQIFSWPISDGTGPALSILSPTNNGHLSVGPSFNLAALVSDNSSNVALNLVISGNLAVTQNVALVLTPNISVTNVFFVPLSNAPVNGGPITATLTGTDAASNVTSVVRTFWLPNTVGPAIAQLLIASNQPPVGGLTVPVQAIVAGNPANVSVQFTQDGNPVGTVTNSPYQVLVTLPASGSTTIRAIATDEFSNPGVAAQLVIVVQVNIPPSVQFTRITPSSGPIPSSSQFAVDVTASGNSNQFNMTATVGGAAPTNNFSGLGTVLHVQGTVPGTVTNGAQVQITAKAVDGLGQSTSLQLLTIPVSDGTPPSLAILSPAANLQLVPGQLLQISSQVADNSSGVTLQLVMSGAVSSTQSLPVALSPNVSVTNTFNIQIPNDTTNGSPVVATLTATDPANNISTVARVFWLPGTNTTIIWNRQAFGQTIQCTNKSGSFVWPNNNNWSQSLVLGDPCGTGNLVPVQPSNWNTTNYPNNTNLDVVLGSLGGAPTRLDVQVTVHSLNILSDGALDMSLNAPGSWLGAVNFFFQGDGAITRSGCCSLTTLSMNGGIMEKMGGTNTFTIDPAIVLNSTNGILAADSGTLVLPGNNSYYTNGGFNVASNATVALVPAGYNVNFAGNFTGTGKGTVSLNTGTLSTSAGGLTFDLPAPLFQWSGGTLTGNNPLTNAGTMELSGPNGGRLIGTLNNAGLFHQTGAGNLAFSLTAPGSYFENLASGIYWLESDAGMTRVDCCSPTVFDNYGLLRKSGGISNSTILPVFNNLGGTIVVETGTLTLAGAGSSSNGNFTVSSGAVLDVTGGTQPTWAGQMNGAGGGTVLLNSGKIFGGPNATLNFVDGMFQWSGGVLHGPFTNVNVLSISSLNDSKLENALYNNSLVRHIGSNHLNFSMSAPGAFLQNLPGATYQFENDGSFGLVDCCSQTVFENDGLLRKIGGLNESRIDGVWFNNLGGTIEVQTGRLTLANNGTSSNGTFTVSANAAIDLTGGQVPTWAGILTGTGAGRVEFNSGRINTSPSATLNFAPGLFQWTGGRLNGLTTNLNTMALSGAGDVSISGTFENAGLFRHFGAGGLGMSESAPGARFQNLAGAIYRLESQSGIFLVDCCSAVNFDNFGTFVKSVSLSNVVVSVPFNNLGGLVDVKTGTLILANNGSSSNGTMTVAAGAALDVTGGQPPTWAGRMIGRGLGAISLANGSVNANPSVTLDFTNGLFQWSGGTLAGTSSNANVIMMSGNSGNRIVGRLDNGGLIRHTGSGYFGISESGGGSFVRNWRGATYQFETDANIIPVDCCSAAIFENDGLVRKIGGGGNTIISVYYDNLGGTNEVNTGQLIIANNGSSSNGTFNVAAGAVVDLTGGAQPTWTGTLIGNGAGQVQLNSGQINANNLVLNCAPGVFQWNGGRFVGTVTNAGEMHISGGTVQFSFYNAGTVRHTGASGLGISEAGGGSIFRNLAGATYEFEGNGSIFGTDCCSVPTFSNAGLLRKSGGLTIATISTAFSNTNGSIEVDTGTLSVAPSAYAQGTGSFTVQLGGTNLGQWGQLSAGSVSLAGPLAVKLVNDFVPAIGQQFQILASSSLSGTFSTLDVPAGIKVIYSSSGVFLSVTGQVSAAQSPQTTTPLPSLTIMKDSNKATLQWLADSNLILESTTNLWPGAAWTPFTNVPMTVTNGMFNATFPASNSTRYFRLRPQ